MSAERQVRYADSGGLQIAYEVTGDGPIDIVAAFESGSSIDMMQENPRIARFIRRMGEFGRFINVDLRGVGLSDPIEDSPPLEDWVSDVQVVLDEVGSPRAALIGHGFGAQMCMLFAAMHPDMTTALVTINGFARLRQAPDYPWGCPASTERNMLAYMAANWGTGTVLSSFNPAMAEGPGGPEWVARVERASATPRRSVRRQELIFDIDVRDILPAISVPTLVIQSAGDTYVRPGHARYLNEQIAGARLVELPGVDHTPTASEDAAVLLRISWSGRSRGRVPTERS